MDVSKLNWCVGSSIVPFDHLCQLLLSLSMLLVFIGEGKLLLLI